MNCCCEKSCFEIVEILYKVVLFMIGILSLIGFVLAVIQAKDAKNGKKISEEGMLISMIIYAVLLVFWAFLEFFLICMADKKFEKIGKILK